MSKKSYRCPVCGIVFERYACDVRGSDPTCSYACYHKKTRTGKTVPCDWCGEPVYVSKRNLEKSEYHFCNQQCLGKFLSKTTKGINVKETVKEYRTIETKNGKKRIHRLIVEICLGRSLPSSLAVHHINEVKSDNRIANIEVYTRADHARLHMGIEVKPIWSGRDFLESLQNRPRKLHKLRKSLIGSLGQVDVDWLLQLS